MLSLVKDAETGQRGFLLAQRAEYLEPYLAAVSEVDAEFARLTELSAARPAQQPHVANLRSHVTRKLQELAATVRLGQQGGIEVARAQVLTGYGMQLM